MANTSGPSRRRSTTRVPAIASSTRWRSASVPLSVDPSRRNFMFAHRSIASCLRLISPRLYDARAKSIALDPSTSVLSRSKNAAALPHAFEL